MNLTTPMLNIFKIALHQHCTLQDISKQAMKSIGWTSQVLGQLTDVGLITSYFKANIKSSRKIYKIASTSYAMKLRDLILSRPTIDFSSILAGYRLKILLSILFDWKDYKTIAVMSGSSIEMVRHTLPRLRNRGLSMQRKKLHKFNEAAWPELFEFLKELRNYTDANLYLLWKYYDEMIFIVDKEKLVTGELTGFNRYKEYGITVVNVTGCCYLPKRKLSKREVFIHSLLQVNDPRTLHLALTFYIKHKLDDTETMKLAMRYDCYSRYEELRQLPNVSLDIYPAKTFNTLFDKKDFKRIANMYGVKNV
ncbi:hypothetical protein HYU06_05490 [Candidatus Woesearchaeota archaeon]|nr:hypothetical protein [Candidatus Woesearchaeota archaeon]